MQSIRSIAVLVTALLVLGACGSESETTPAKTVTQTETVTTEEAETTDETEDGAGGAAAAADLDVEFTPAGEQLELGEKAIVPIVSDRPAAVGIALTGIRKGREAELAPLELGQQVSGMTPYYLQVEVTNESGGDHLAFFSAPLLSPLLGDGSSAQRISVIGDFPPCSNEDGGKDFTDKGDTFRTCILAVASGSAKVTGLEYTSPPQEEIPGSPDYLDKPITWQQ